MIRHADPALLTEELMRIGFDTDPSDLLPFVRESWSGDERLFLAGIAPGSIEGVFWTFLVPTHGLRRHVRSAVRDMEWLMSFAKSDFAAEILMASVDPYREDAKRLVEWLGFEDLGIQCSFYTLGRHQRVFEKVLS